MNILQLSKSKEQVMEVGHIVLNLKLLLGNDDVCFYPSITCKVQTSVDDL